jgi:Na+/phosphate symporter
VNVFGLIERHFIASPWISAYATFVSVLNGQPAALLIVFAYLGLILRTLIGTVDCSPFHGSLAFFLGSQFLSRVPRATVVPILTQGRIFISA